MERNLSSHGTLVNIARLINWFVFDPLRFGEFEKYLNIRERIRWSLLLSWSILAISVALWLITIISMLTIDLPHYIPRLYTRAFVESWSAYASHVQHINIILHHINYDVLITVAIGILLGPLISSAMQLSYGMYICCSLFGVTAIISGSCLYIPDNSYSYVLWAYIACALAFGPICYKDIHIILMYLALLESAEFIQELAVAYHAICPLYNYLILAVPFVFLYSATKNLWYGFLIITVTAFLRKAEYLLICDILLVFLINFRLVLIPYYQLSSLLKTNFDINPYISDGVIVFPLWKLDAKLTELAYIQPDKAFTYYQFLITYRPFQRYLAERILHASTAGLWSKSPLDADVLKFPVPDSRHEIPRLPSNLIEGLTDLRRQLIACELQTQVSVKKSLYEDFSLRLDGFKGLIFRELPKHKYYYLCALERWRIITDEKIMNIRAQAQNVEPVVINIYRPGEALRPETDYDVFVGRQDIKNKLSSEILTAKSVPMFLIQGQRRVGKTSLINFLPELLGARFKIIYQDLQARSHSVLQWMTDLRSIVGQAYSMPFERWHPPDEWIDAWTDLSIYISNICRLKDHKILLAFDEYEVLHNALQEDLIQAKKLLSAMRSFSQHQNQIVFLFIGTNLFSELNNPNWSEYFVHILRLRVDYLTEGDASKLIRSPVENFPLSYSEFLFNEIYSLTQGHPALLQLVCKKMVDIANEQGRREMQEKDLAEVVDDLLDRENLVISIFWSQFCTKSDKKSIRALLEGNRPEHKPSIMRLKEHGFIVEIGDGWKIRVPLFEMWLKKHIDSFEDEN